jgi:hypothetical protein
MRKDMSNKTIVLILLALFIASIGSIVLIGNTGASMDISNTYEIEGVGVIDRSLEIKTSSLVGEGQMFTESIHGSAFGAQSEMNLSQNIEVITACNDTDISVYGALTATEARAKQYMRNYDIGSIHGYKLMGVARLEYDYIAENYSSSMHIDGETAGKMEFLIKLKELNTHKTIFCDELSIGGYTKYDIESFIENVSYPASGEEGDWLGCP